MTNDYDVIVVGAGFAGVTAARECELRGFRTLVLEGRDRIGGRTHTTTLENGEVAELGGTYVHWSQPHLWSEITRYGLEDDLIDAFQMPDAALVPQDGGIGWIDGETLMARDHATTTKFFENSREVFPYPFDVMAQRDKLKALDNMSVQDRIDEIGLSPDESGYLAALLGMESQRPVAESSYLFWLRVWANAGHDATNANEALFGKRLRNGTKSILDAMVADGGFELRLGTKVTSVVSSSDGVTVTTADGEQVSASAVVVATPSGVWPYIDFTPKLSDDRLRAVKSGLQTPRGSKVVAVLRGEPRNVMVSVGQPYPVGVLWTVSRRSDDEQVVEVIDTAGMKDIHDHDEVRAGIKALLPHVEVVEVISEKYDLDDEFSRGSWPFFAKGTFTDFEPSEKLSLPEGRIAFACSEIAKGWCGFIDGAIEAGLRAARNVRPFAEEK
ncbi:MAG: hypothetical protein QOD39_4359 [Mycobacterium sp.]|nr:hypothetical protein [Mycobacterium sp.]